MATEAEDFEIPDLLAPIHHALTTADASLTEGNLPLSGGNFAFLLLCEKLGVDPDDLVFDPQWASKPNAYKRVTYSMALQPGEYKLLKGGGVRYRCISCAKFVDDANTLSKIIPEHVCERVRSF